MDLTEEQIRNFQQIYFQKFGEKINKEEARRKGLKLLNFLKAILE